MTALRAALAVATASRYALGAVAGCAAPLWCRVVGHKTFLGGAIDDVLEERGLRLDSDGVIRLKDAPQVVLKKAWHGLCIRCGEWV